MAGCSLFGRGRSASQRTAATATSPASVAAVATATAPSVPANPSAAAPVTNDFATVIRQVSQLVKPAIVQITNQQQVQSFFSNQPFTVPAGVGSGIIYSPDGHILTNAHVVEGAQQLLVSLPDGRSFQAKLIGADTQTDLAVVQINASNLPVAQLGDSGQLQVGDWVVAIGNALALPGGPTVTAGVVGALGRTVQEPGSNGGPGPFLFNVIQTDAPINPGNSGGALINLSGEVIGINTLVAGQAQGIGFAIATRAAKPIADQLVATGKVIHPYMGLSYLSLNPAIAYQVGAKETQGVVVADVAAGSPAAKVGLQRGDVIIQVDGAPVTGDSDLAQIVHNHKPGDTLSFTVDRQGTTSAVKLTLGEAPAA
ncbi:MAG: trypsin-like peptidase domain-containing protein [Caldilineaceae bacterium]